MRLDKYIADMTYYSRKEIKSLVKKGQIKVNDMIVKNSDMQVNDNDEVMLFDEVIKYQEFEYFILNKPKDYLTASYDDNSPYVMELIDSPRNDLVPVGRLDKDTEGLLLITNNGKLNHDLLSPKHHVSKKYYVVVEKEFADTDKEILENPLDLGDFITQGAIFEKIDKCSCYLTIWEGKFHQVKRMMEKINNKVTYLQRVEFGPLKLQEIKTGEYRNLTEREIEELLLLND